jgi:threonine synthase
MELEPGRLEPRRITSRPADQWRYREALPFLNWHERISLGEGMTPLVPTLHAKIPFLAKLDYIMPTGSFKDRGASMLMTFLGARGIRTVVEDSSGNAGAALACYAARARVGADIYVPAHASPEKIRAIARFGARVVKIRGTRDDVTTAAWAATRRTCYASHVWNPYFLHGTKTCAFEIVEQLGWKAPDWVIVPAGSGTLLLGLHAGFLTLREQGLIDGIPRLAASQSRNCNPLERYVAGKRARPARPTLAEGVATAKPPRLEEMARALRECRGRVYAAREGRIVPAMISLWNSGIYVEPTSALGLTALEDLAAEESLDGRKVVVILTGSGLKFSRGAQEYKIRRRNRKTPGVL